MDNLLKLIEKKIDNGEMLKAKELLQNKYSSTKIKRPPNSNIIYTNQLGELGLLNIVREFSNKCGIKKQRVVSISKKVSNFLWEKLSDRHQKYFLESV